MNLLQEIKEEREELKEEITQHGQTLINDALDAVAEGNQPQPVLIAIIGQLTETYFPHWTNDLEKAAAMDKLNTMLDEKGVTATAFVFPCKYGDTDTDNIAGPAVALLLRTHNWKELVIAPYRHTLEGDLIVEDPITEKDFGTSLITVPHVES